MVANGEQPRHLLPRLHDKSLGVHRGPGRGDDGTHERRTPRRRRELEDVANRVAACMHIVGRKPDVPDRVLPKPGCLKEDGVRRLAVVNNG